MEEVEDLLSSHGEYKAVVQGTGSEESRLKTWRMVWGVGWGEVDGKYEEQVKDGVSIGRAAPNYEREIR